MWTPGCRLLKPVKSPPVTFWSRWDRTPGAEPAPPGRLPGAQWAEDLEPLDAWELAATRYYWHLDTPTEGMCRFWTLEDGWEHHGDSPGVGDMLRLILEHIPRWRRREVQPLLHAEWVGPDGWRRLSSEPVAPTDLYAAGRLTYRYWDFLSFVPTYSWRTLLRLAAERARRCRGRGWAWCLMDVLELDMAELEAERILQGLQRS